MCYVVAGEEKCRRAFIACSKRGDSAKSRVREPRRVLFEPAGTNVHNHRGRSVCGSGRRRSDGEPLAFVEGGRERKNEGKDLRTAIFGASLLNARYRNMLEREERGSSGQIEGGVEGVGMTYLWVVLVPSGATVMGEMDDNKVG